MRSVVGKPGVALALSILPALLVACGGLSPPPASTPSPIIEAPTPTATPTVTVQTGGLDGFRAYAVQIAAALATGDTALFTDHAVQDEITCTGDEETGICFNQSAGTVLRGIPGAVAQSDAFTLYPPTEYAELLRNWFASAAPDGDPTLYAITHRPAGQGSEEAYQAVVMGIFVVEPAGSTVLRKGRIFDFQFIDGSWRLTGELYASVPESTEPWLSGDCSECYDHWERWMGATP
jgi:hypothetical protein